MRAHFGYGSKVVSIIDDLTVSDGEVVGLIGRSGSGKTTILSTLGGSIPLIDGTLLIDSGIRPEAWRLRNSARSIQSFPLLHWLTVEQNLQEAAKIRSVGEFSPTKLLETLRIPHLAKKYPTRISGGERARVSLCLALVAKPKFLLLDEPFSGLDVVVKQEVASLVFDIARDRLMTVVFVTHDLYDAVKFTDRIAVLSAQQPSTLSAIIPSSKEGVVERIPELLRSA